MLRMHIERHVPINVMCLYSWGFGDQVVPTMPSPLQFYSHCIGSSVYGFRILLYMLSCP